MLTHVFLLIPIVSMCWHPRDCFAQLLKELQACHFSRWFCRIKTWWFCRVRKTFTQNNYLSPEQAMFFRWILSFEDHPSHLSSLKTKVVFSYPIFRNHAVPDFVLGRQYHKSKNIEPKCHKSTNIISFHHDCIPNGFSSTAASMWNILFSHLSSQHVPLHSRIFTQVIPIWSNDGRFQRTT